MCHKLINDRAPRLACFRPDVRDERIAREVVPDMRILISGMIPPSEIAAALDRYVGQLHLQIDRLLGRKKTLRR
ncbi:hypothetical protein AS156_25725 [Bradyrhizobium macuxiense]|uniref:Uncharacterized protein n=2 Tax=Bradyrhizobium macuxiense TaxID=1755647 RepID=A0A120FS53_9BRAD|nr:hypothetical protein AS156_25725 [Bradyrhizobium macuxiense]